MRRTGYRGAVTSDAELHARRASSFGSQASQYAEYRPGYPAAALDWILPADATHVLDLGAGTGKLTESLLARGITVTAVDPDNAMLAELRNRFPAAAALTGTAEEIPVGDASVDAVVVGQAFHWFDMPRALAEIGRVLRPGGALGALWNHEDHRVSWVAGFDSLIRTSSSRAWTHPGPVPGHPAFGRFERREFDHSVRRTAESLTAMVGTHSHMLVCGEAERDAVISRLLAYLKGRPETSAGEFDFPLTTTVFRAQRVD
jgi:SAM-dependent methyltransferase